VARRHATWYTALEDAAVDVTEGPVPVPLPRTYLELLICLPQPPVLVADLSLGELDELLGADAAQGVAAGQGQQIEISALYLDTWLVAST
jgi:hypothetical protein